MMLLSWELSQPNYVEWHHSGKGVDFKFDTGAEVSAVSEETYRRVHGKQLQRPTKALCGPAYQSLKVLGQFEGQLSAGGRSHKETVLSFED